MTLSEELQWRGFIQDSTFADLTQLDSQQWVFYHGFDASADSQTIGNLAAMMLDKAMLRHGHKAILLAGGSTSLIGDPGGKDKERPVQSEETIAKNVEIAQAQISKVLSGHEFQMVNNLDWTKDMKVLDFLRDIGKHYSMTPLVQRDYIATRMGEGGSGISYTEFSYTLLQGMDYLHLFDNFGCTLQLGGADQWGNCLSGVELIRKARGKEAHVITLPLIINKATGKKFGKSEEGAIWLDPDKTSPYQFYQFWLNFNDEGVESYLRVFTELGREEIEAIMAEHQQSPQLRVAQTKLAQEVTRLVHGQETLDQVVNVTSVIFGSEHAVMSEQTKQILLSELPTAKYGSLSGLDLAQVLVDLGLASSKSEARQFFDDGAVKAGTSSQKIELGSDLSSFNELGIVIIRRGKNRLGIIDVQ